MQPGAPVRGRGGGAYEARTRRMRSAYSRRQVMAVAARRSAWGLFLTLAMGAWCAAPAHAQRTSSLSWVRLPGTEGCIPTQTLAERVEQRVGRQVFVSASQADLSLEGHVERSADASAFVATLAVSDREGRVLGKRVLRAQGNDCSALDPALVLVIAIGLDPDAALPATRDASNQLSGDTQALLSQLQLPKLDENALRDLAVPDPEAVRAEEARARETAQRAEAERAARERARKHPKPTGRNASPSVRVSLGLGIDGELGVLPNPALGATLRATFGFGGLWPIELSVTGLLPQSKAGERTSGHGELTFVAAGLALCTPGNGSRSFELFACLGARGGLLRAAGSGFADNLDVTSVWVEPALLAGPRLHLDSERRWSLELRAGPGVPLIRDTYRYQGEMGVRRRLHRASAIIGRLELAAGVSF